MKLSAKNTQLAAATENDPRCPRPAGGRGVLLLSQNNWRILPAILRGASGETGERSVPHNLRGVDEIETNSYFDVRASFGDRRTSICRLIKRLT